jgi:hypothetical protein
MKKSLKPEQASLVDHLQIPLNLGLPNSYTPCGEWIAGKWLCVREKGHKEKNPNSRCKAY